MSYKPVFEIIKLQYGYQAVAVLVGDEAVDLASDGLYVGYYNPGAREKLFSIDSAISVICIDGEILIFETWKKFWQYVQKPTNIIVAELRVHEPEIATLFTVRYLDVP